MEGNKVVVITLFPQLKFLEDYLEEFTKKHYQKIIQKMEISEEDLKEAVHEIIRLNPKPGGSLKESSKSLQQVVPDFQIRSEERRVGKECRCWVSRCQYKE